MPVGIVFRQIFACVAAGGGGVGTHYQPFIYGASPWWEPRLSTLPPSSCLKALPAEIFYFFNPFGHCYFTPLLLNLDLGQGKGPGPLGVRAGVGEVVARVLKLYCLLAATGKIT